MRYPPATNHIPGPDLVYSASVVQQQHVDPSKPRRAKGDCSAVADTDWVARVQDLSQGYKTLYVWLVRCQPCATFPGDPSCEPLLGHPDRALANQSAAQPTRSCTSPEDLRVLQRWIQKMHAAVETMLTHFLRVSRSFIQITLKVCKHKINDISFPNNLQLPQNLWPVTIAQEINSLANGHVSAFTSQDWMHPPPPSKLWDGDMAREDQRKIRNTSNSLLKICELWKSIDIWKRKKRFHNLTSIPTSTMSWDRPMKAA